MSELLKTQDSPAEGIAQPLYVPIKRRSFFMYAGATAGATALVLSGCSDDEDNNVTPSKPAGNSMVGDAISLGSGDVGVLNYAYALEQLEADFYDRVSKLTNGAALLGNTEFAYFQQVAKHEAIHRDFFKAALTRDAAGQVLRGLTPKYGTVFTNPTRDGILGTAKAFEDLGVAAYNGAGKLIKTPAYLVLAGQIVSVEARHAAYVRDLISNGSFAADDQVNELGLDKAMTPGEVLTIAQGFITEKLDGSSVGVN